MDEEIIFEDYNIKVTEEELKQIDKKTLKKCKKVCTRNISETRKLNIIKNNEMEN